MEEVTYYLAFEGSRFESKQECEKFEKKLIKIKKFNETYILYDKNGDVIKIETVSDLMKRIGDVLFVKVIRERTEKERAIIASYFLDSKLTEIEHLRQKGLYFYQFGKLQSTDWVIDYFKNVVKVYDKLSEEGE